MQALGYNNLAYHLVLSGDTVAARETVDTGLAFARERFLPLATTWLWSTSGEIALVERRWDAAAADIRRSIGEAERSGTRTRSSVVASISLSPHMAAAITRQRERAPGRYRARRRRRCLMPIYTCRSIIGSP